MLRRRFLAFLASPLPLIVQVQVLLDQGVHQNQGLTALERAKLWRLQETARREYAVSGIRFDVRVTEGAYLRTQSYTKIPDAFLVADRINVFVTETLRLDVDNQRTGGSSVGTPNPGRPSGRIYMIFLGLREAGEGTLAHEYAHHLTLDTAANASTRGNHWADLRNDYWLWRQRQGTPIAGFRAAEKAPWVSHSTHRI